MGYRIDFIGLFIIIIFYTVLNRLIIHKVASHSQYARGFLGVGECHGGIPRTYTWTSTQIRKNEVLTTVDLWVRSHTSTVT